MIFGNNSKYMLKYQKAKAKLVEFSVLPENYPQFNLNSNELSYPSTFILSRYAECIIENNLDEIKELSSELLFAAQYYDAALNSKDRTQYDLDFMNMHLVTSKDANGAQISPGGFNQTDTALQTFSRTTLAAFPDNWMHTAVSGNESFTATMDCKNILLSYKLSSDDDFGFACVYIDGEFVTELFG